MCRFLKNIQLYNIILYKAKRNNLSIFLINLIFMLTAFK